MIHLETSCLESWDSHSYKTVGRKPKTMSPRHKNKGLVPLCINNMSTIYKYCSFYFSALCKTTQELTELLQTIRLVLWRRVKQNLNIITNVHEIFHFSYNSYDYFLSQGSWNFCSFCSSLVDCVLCAVPCTSALASPLVVRSCCSTVLHCVLLVDSAESWTWAVFVPRVVYVFSLVAFK